ncbi:hypothetical protein ABT124_49205 [Streptomyces sp. NPDC001982]|uniref:hypothetical protein n=1 Tax=unclassified Streptomyces TaxID=2593676 RepID=UPI00332D7BBE
MFTSRRRNVAGAAALALTTLALSACSGGGNDGRADASTPASVTTSPFAPASTPASASASAAASATTPDGSTAPGSTSAPGGGTAPGSTATPGAPARWAGTKQFMQITDAWITNRRTYLSVRSARKQSATGDIEAWVIIPGQGPYSTVSMATDGRVLLSVPLGDNSVPYSYSQAEFVRRVKLQSPAFLEGLGFDLTFDNNGQVTRLQSLYTP